MRLSVKVIVGLGNPGPEYARTPHNVGFEALATLARRWSCELRPRARFDAHFGKAVVAGEERWLIRPDTYMNESGRAVAGVVGYFGLPPEGVLVMLDDADLEPGSLRIRPFGSSGGHRGLASVIAALGTDRFPRLRIGIGRGGGEAGLVSHVLAAIRTEDEVPIREAIDRAAEAVEVMLQRGVEAAMNRFNMRRRPAPEEDDERRGGDV